MTSPRPPRRQGNLPLEALAALAQPHIGVAVGDVWWIPEKHLNYCSGKEGRFCVLVALETLAGDGHPSRAYLIVGSTSPEWDVSVPEVVVKAGEGELPEDTFFSFRLHSELQLADLQLMGHYRGRLSPARIAEIDEALNDSSLLVIKKVLKQ